jgi:hypothetical protein
MTIVQIPLTNIPQAFSISLNNVTYNLSLRWNEKQGWILDIADIDENSLISNIPLTTGRDLLEPYAYLGFGGKLYVFNQSNTDVPTYDNLGTDTNLYFVTKEG